MLVILITLAVYPGISLLPVASRPRKAVVTKYIENKLIEYSAPHDSKDSLSKRARPKVLAFLCSGVDLSERNVDIGPLCPAL